MIVISRRARTSPTINPAEARGLTAGGKAVSFDDILIGGPQGGNIRRFCACFMRIVPLTGLAPEINLLARRLYSRE